MKAALIVAGVVAFLGVSILVTRVLAADSRERSDVIDLIAAQSRGDATEMLRLLDGCGRDARCRARVRENAARLRRPGEIQVLRFDPSTQWAFTGGENGARIAWKTDRTTIPVVQCVTVRRTGDVLSGPGVELVGLSGARGREAGC